MDNTASPALAERPQVHPESLSGPSSFMPLPTRRDTASTTASDRFLPIAVTLSIHGNCSRCHHHHKSLQIKVPLNPRETTHIACEKCSRRWLTFSGNNATQLSLLSARTTTIDFEEDQLRRTLVQIVRSAMPAAAVASPTLASVPEASRIPSQGKAVCDHPQDAIVSAHDPGIDQASLPDTHQTRVPSEDSNKQPGIIPNVPTAHKAGLRKKTLTDLKRKLKIPFSFLMKMRFGKKYLREKKQPKGKGPLRHHGTDDWANPEEGGKATVPEQDGNSKEEKPQTGVQEHCGPNMSLDQALREVDEYNKNVILKMDPDDRAAWVRDKGEDWIREHITKFRCRCARRCFCRYNRSTPSLLDSIRFYTTVDSPRMSFQAMGVHLDDYPYPYPGFLPSDRSETRTSEADTAVGSESYTATAGPMDSQFNTEYHQRPRSLSPPPAPPFTSPRHSSHLRHQAFEARDSMDSMITGHGAGSSSRIGRRGADRRSLPSTLPPGPSRPDTPGTRSHIDRTTPDEDDSAHTLRAPSAPSTPHLNGYRTDDERNGNSDSTPSRDRRHS